MRSLIFVFFSLISSLSAHSQTLYNIIIANSSPETVSYSVDNDSFVDISPSDSIELKDSVDLDKGYFGPDVGVASIKIRLKSNNQHHLTSTTIPIQLINNSKIRINITGRVNNNTHGYKIDGLPFETNQSDLIEAIIVKKKAYTFQQKAQYKLVSNRQNSRQQIDSIQKRLMYERDEYLSYVEQAIISVKDSYLAYHLFNSEFMNPKNILRLGKHRIIKTFDLLSPTLHSTDAAITSKNFVQKMRSNAVGSKIQNFQFKTKDLAQHDLYNYFKDSEYALLIFTAKWCGACIAQIPIIKDIENKMQPKLKVVYVSIDRSMTDWLATLKSGYSGIVTLNVEPYNNGKDLQDLFNVNYIPQLFLVDKNLKIIYDNLSPYEDDSLDDLKVILGL